MKKINTLLIIALGLFLTNTTKAQTTSDFENITLKTNSYWNGSDYSKGFTSGNAKFNNIYDSAFGGSWGSWSVSNMKDSVTAGYMNQYSVCNGMGYNSSNYAVAYYSNYTPNPTIVLTGAASGKTVAGCWINNSTYAYMDMKNGTPSVSKKFGGVNGTDADYFKLRAIGYLGGKEILKKVDLMLADFTSSDSTKDYILKNWTWLDLSVLGNIDSVQFTMESTDTGSFGINTPTYFCMDNFTTNNTALSISENSIHALYMYPNPASNVLSVSEYGEKATISILDMTGKYIIANNIMLSNSIDISAMNSGVYIIQISKNDIVYTAKFVKE